MVGGAPRVPPRRGRMSLTVPVGPGVRCTAAEGKLEMRAEMDFSTLDRDRLEAAIEAFFAVLQRR
jgi:ParB family transcriptional regulator, chromosome partitioning protein